MSLAPLCLALALLSAAPAGVPSAMSTPSPHEPLEAAVRAGEAAQARAAIAALRARTPPLSTAEASAAADFLIGRGEWELSRALLEALPQAEPGWGYLYVRHLREAAGGDAARLQQVDAWLAQRAQPRSAYWVRERRTFLQDTSGTGPLFEGLEANLRAHPSDLEAVRVYLEALQPGERPLAWLPTVVKPTQGYDILELAQWLGTRAPREALAVLARAPATLGDEGKRRIRELIRRTWSVVPGMQLDPQVLYARWVRTLKVDCLKATGQHQAAQALLVELGKEEAGPLPSFALSQQAGQIQASTPTHPLEERIVAAEPANERSTAYWSGRADYYRGRGDAAKEREALERALALTALPAKPSLEAVQDRAGPARAFADFLKRTQGPDAAVAFLWREYDAVDDVALHGQVLQLLLFDYERDDRRLLRPDDARLWAWLEAQPTWEGTPERLLWRMASAATEGAARDAVWARAEAAAKRKPARAAVVGWVMNRTQAARRSLAVLEVACAEHSDEERRRSACFTLLESDLDTLRWKEAEALWPQASLRLTATERPDWLGKVAVCAARAGAPEEAVRLWAQKDALDFAALGHLEELGKTSARPALIRYYETLQRERPSSTVPPTALARLRAMK